MNMLTDTGTKLSKRPDKLVRLRRKWFRILAKRGFAFDAPKIELLTFVPLTTLERDEKLAGYLSYPVETLQKWKAVIFTDQGAYQMTPSCICCDREQGRQIGQINVTFGPLDATRQVLVEARYILDETGTCLRKEYVRAILQCEDTYRIVYAINTCLKEENSVVYDIHI